MKKIFNILIVFFLSIGILFAQHLKKDGTPDMRYKENKTPYSTSTNSGTHLKKDGTPDMRYKENKTTYSVPSSPSNTGHLKNDGTPDMRYRENNPKYNSQLQRDKNGKIIRSESAIYEFKKKTGYPKGRPGYVIDHIIPLKKGGCDCPENMQWQTIEEAKAKDKWE